MVRLYFDWSGLFVSAPLPPFLLQFVDCAGLPRLTSWIGAASPGWLLLAARVT